MTERDAFLADVCQHPDEDAPRLIFADWLEDHGEPERAAFIRAQCAGDAHALRKYSLHLREWAGFLGKCCQSWQYHRGFIESIHVSGQVFLDCAEQLFAAAPIRYVWLSSLYTDHLGAIASLPQLARLAVLKAPGNYRHVGFQTICSSPRLAHLAGLSVNDTPIGPIGIQVFCEAPALSHLSHLNLAGTGIGLEGVELLSGSPKCQNLIAFDLRGNALDVRALRALDRSPYFHRLRRLGFWYNRLGDDGLSEFVQLPLFSRLVHLSLGNNRFTERGLLALANAPALANLRTIWLGVDRYSEESVERLICSPYLHPEARIGFWLNDNLSEGTKQYARSVLGDRVCFDDPGGTWDSDAPVSWPLWRPASN